LTKLQQMQKEHLIDLEDACIVVRSAHARYTSSKPSI
jgi:uncharacterized membrane protein